MNVFCLLRSVYRNGAVIILVLLLSFRASADDAKATDPNDLGTVSTTDYHDYQKVHLIEVTPLGLRCSWDGGIGLIDFQRLSPEMQTKYGYDKAKYDAAKAEGASHDAQSDAIIQEATAQKVEGKTEDDLRAAFVHQAEEAKKTPIGAGFNGIVFNVVNLSKDLSGYLARTYNGHFIGNYIQWDGPVVLLIDPDHKYVDDDHAEYKTIYYCGTWQYTSTAGATSTVRVCTPSLDSAVRLYGILHRSN